MEQQTLTAEKADRNIKEVYSPNWGVLSAMVAQKRRPTPMDALALNANAPSNAAPEYGLTFPTDDLMLILFNELMRRVHTGCLSYAFGILVRDGWMRYLRGKDADASFHGSMRSEDDILSSHRPDMRIAREFYSGSATDKRKIDAARPWNAENPVKVRPNVTEIRIVYELMHFFGADFRSVLVQLLYDGVQKYLEAGRAGESQEEPGLPPPKASDPKARPGP